MPPLPACLHLVGSSGPCPRPSLVKPHPRRRSSLIPALPAFQQGQRPPGDDASPAPPSRSGIGHQETPPRPSPPSRSAVGHEETSLHLTPTSVEDTDLQPDSRPTTAAVPLPPAADFLALHCLLSQGGMVERRRLLLIPAISISVGSFQYTLEKGVAKAEFADSIAHLGQPAGRRTSSVHSHHALSWINKLILFLADRGNASTAVFQQSMNFSLIAGGLAVDCTQDRTSSQTCCDNTQLTNRCAMVSADCGRKGDSVASPIWRVDSRSNIGPDCQPQEELDLVGGPCLPVPALRGKDYGKTKMRYPDYTETVSGLQYKDLRVGDGPTPKKGDTVVVDWDGYTIGYYGRIFEARNKTKGGSFEGGDKDFFKFKLGSGQVIPAFEEALSGMAPGGVRRIIVPPDLGYPDNDLNKLGPKPTTFSGQRALDFVLRNQGLIDKTLLFDIELLKIIPSQ